MSTSVEIALDEAIRIGCVVQGTKIQVLGSKHDVSYSFDKIFIDSARSLVPRLMEAGATFKIIN